MFNFVSGWFFVDFRGFFGFSFVDCYFLFIRNLEKNHENYIIRGILLSITSYFLLLLLLLLYYYFYTFLFV